MQHPQGLTLAQYAAAKKLDEEFLASLGLTNTYFDTLKAVGIPYKGINGFTTAVQFRARCTKWPVGAKKTNLAPTGFGS